MGKVVKLVQEPRAKIDPIYGAIKAHRVAYAIFEAEVRHRVHIEDAGGKYEGDADNRTMAAADDAAEGLLDALEETCTVGGMIALLRYVVEFEGARRMWPGTDAPPPLEQDPWSFDLHGRLLKALKGLGEGRPQGSARPDLEA